MTVLGSAAAFGLLVLAGQSSSAANALEPSLDDLTIPGTPVQLVDAFREVCFNNHGSWETMKQNAERSALGFKRISGQGHQQVEYSAFPIAISLKRWGQRGYLCLVQSSVEKGVTANDLAGQLGQSGPGLSGVVFEPNKNGVSAIMPDSGRMSRVGMQYTTLQIRIANDSKQMLPIAQMLISAN